MSDNNQQILDEIKSDIKEILLFQREFKIHKEEQEKVNKQVFKDLKEIENRTNLNESNIELLKREDQYIYKIHDQISKNLESVLKIQEKLNEESSKTNSKVLTHSKIFWGLFTLNLTIVGYIVNSFIKTLG